MVIICGGITMGVGAIALGSAIWLGAQDDYDLLPAAVGLGILGVAGLGVGIPIFAVGFKKKPVRGAEAELPLLEPIPDPAGRDRPHRRHRDLSVVRGLGA